MCELEVVFEYKNTIISSLIFLNCMVNYLKAKVQFKKIYCVSAISYVIITEEYRYMQNYFNLYTYT